MNKKRTSIPNGPKKLRKEEEQAIGETYLQYIDTFQENTSKIPTKVFVKSATLYADNGKEKLEPSQLYTPRPRFHLGAKDEKKQPFAENACSEAVMFNPKKKKNKSKSNLRALGDELKLLQQERQLKDAPIVAKTQERLQESPLIQDPLIGGQKGGETDNHLNSTNLFVSNLHAQHTENHLVRIFGSYGPLASVKIMWPRGEDVGKNANCGFVAFMSRADAERALNDLKLREDMRLSWGKAVKIPSHPIHIPPELYKFYSPPPPSGLPFNAQPLVEDIQDLSDSVVKVTIPLDRNLLFLIHRMIEFVIREGPEFERLITMKEIDNPTFDFLWDFPSAAHTYYRWKLYSMLQGDSKTSWNQSPFRMFDGGSIWIPPLPLNYTDGMPPELVKAKSEKKLSKAQNARLKQLLKNLKTARGSIINAMTFCLNHQGAIDDIVEILIDSLKCSSTKPLKKIARLYLLSDILHNCKLKFIPVTKFGEGNVVDCLGVFKDLRDKQNSLSFEADRENFKSRVLRVLGSWMFHDVYDITLITQMENMFLHGNELGEEDDVAYDEPLDGASLLKRSAKVFSSDVKVVKRK